MKLYLHGPNAGKTLKIRDVQFVNGVAEHPSLPKTFEKFYGVKDYAPEGFVQEGEVIDDQEGAEEEVVSDEQAAAQEELRNLIEQKKSELSVERLKTQKDFTNFGAFKSYVKKTTGTMPRGGKQANELMAKYAEENNCIYEVE